MKRIERTDWNAMKGEMEVRQWTRQCDQIFFECLFCIGQNFDPNWATISLYWRNFHCCYWPNIENII